MKKILMIGMSSTIGGVENFILNLYEKIDKSDIRIDFLTTETFDGFYYDRLVNKLHAKVYNIPSIKGHFFKSKNMIKEIARTNKYDVIHIHLCSAQLFLYARMFKMYYKETKIITHSHSSSVTGLERTIFHYLIRPTLIRNTDYYVACSKVAGEWMFKEKIANSSRLIIIKNGIDTERFDFDLCKRNDFREKYGFNNKFVIGHIGRFEKVKNHDFIVNLFSEYVKINSSARLLLVGDGSLKKSIVERINEMGLTEYVTVFDAISNVEDIYQAIDVFIMPSFFEGLPLVGIEAQTSGLPCILSNNISKEVGLTENAYFVELKMNKWLKLLKSIEKDKRNGRKSCRNEIINSGFDIITETKKIKELYLR